MLCPPADRFSAERSERRKVLVIVGPTGSGKSAISIPIAEVLSGEIISADSRQIYRMLDVGTAKIPASDRKRVPHHFVDVLTPDVDFNAGIFGDQGRDVIEDIFRRGKTPIVVGGSGLYIQALIDGLFDGPPADDALRMNLEARIQSGGISVLLDELRRVDPTAARRMLPSHTRRIIRALEVYHLTGVPISDLQARHVAASFETVMVGLQWDRARLYSRINDRVDEMIEEGLEDEVRCLQAAGYTTRNNALNTVGYKEVFDYLAGETSHPRMIELIKQNSRRYAKRQLTWFRSDDRITWFAADGNIEHARLAQSIVNHFYSN